MNTATARNPKEPGLVGVYANFAIPPGQCRQFAPDAIVQVAVADSSGTLLEKGNFRLPTAAILQTLMNEARSGAKLKTTIYSISDTRDKWFDAWQTRYADAQSSAYDCRSVFVIADVENVGLARLKSAENATRSVASVNFWP